MYVDFNSVYRNQINNFDRLLKFMDRSRMTLTKKWLVLRITIRGIKLSEREERARNLWCVRAAGNVRTRSVSAIDFWNERFFFSPPLSRFHTNDAFNQARMSFEYRCCGYLLKWKENDDFCLKFLVSFKGEFKRVLLLHRCRNIREILSLFNV